MRKEEDDVDGVRLRLWTVATNGVNVSPLGDIWAWRTRVERYRQGKLLIRPTELSGKTTSNHLVESRRNWRRKWWILPYEVSHTSKGSLTCRNWPDGFTSPWKERMLPILIALNNLSPSAGRMRLTDENLEGRMRMSATEAKPAIEADLNPRTQRTQYYGLWFYSESEAEPSSETTCFHRFLDLKLTLAYRWKYPGICIGPSLMGSRGSSVSIVSGFVSRPAPRPTQPPI
jgi:hypothetical protein